MGSDVGDDELECVAELVKIAMEAGRKWLGSLDVEDWRSRRYRDRTPRRRGPGHGAFNDPKIGKPPIHIEDTVGMLRHAVLKGVPDDARRYNVIVTPDPPSEKVGQKWVCILRVVPSVNQDQHRHVNFNVWFHGISNADFNRDLVIGWRFECSEGKDTSHNLFHAQPLRAFHRDERFEGFVDWMPETFPTIPVAAKNQVQLAMAALITLGGKEALRKIVLGATHGGLRSRAREFWGSLFAGEALKSDV
jgi:hypothetical protein